MHIKNGKCKHTEQGVTVHHISPFLMVSKVHINQLHLNKSIYIVKCSSAREILECKNIAPIVKCIQYQSY